MKKFSNIITVTSIVVCFCSSVYALEPASERQAAMIELKQQRAERAKAIRLEAELTQSALAAIPTSQPVLAVRSNLDIRSILPPLELELPKLVLHAFRKTNQLLLSYLNQEKAPTRPARHL